MPATWVEKIMLCLDVVQGVQGLHEANIIHGDLKGDNILVFLSAKGIPRAKISDFGFSSTLSSLQSKRDPDLSFFEIRNWSHSFVA